MYRVEWLGAALDELTAIWADADSTLRRTVTRASDMIDQRLQTNPQDEGESRPHGRRITFVSPLAVTFRVHATKQLVRVIRIRLYRSRAD